MLWAEGLHQGKSRNSSSAKIPQTVSIPLIININQMQRLSVRTASFVGRTYFDHSTCVHTVVGFQLVLEAELLPTAVTFIGLLPGVDALVALQRALISEAAPAELALVWMVPC